VAVVRVCPFRIDGSAKKGWWGYLQRQDAEGLVLRAPLQHPADLGYVTFAPEDTMVERYWFRRWYNIFSLYDAGGGLKGWYANLCTPIHFDGESLQYTDLELDLWVWPNRSYLVLDESEFRSLVVPRLSAEALDQVHAAFQELLADVQGPGRLFREPPGL